MDHLPSPLRSTIPHVEVPFIAKLQYDFLGFETFPFRHGFVKDGKLDTSRPPEQRAAPMQSWLYFGLLSEFTARPIVIGDFVKASSSTGLPIVSSSNLFSCLNEWNCRLRQLRMVSRSWRDVVNTTKRLLHVAMKASCLFDYLPGLDDPQHAVVAVSIRTLIMILVWTYNFCCHQ